ncbi:MAG: glutamine--tRNA ligase/YqeY domain fusion protein [Endozoicomonadaceae bacterium]|nr:glutamine--tRNA ligase/YqeY domain fusion protein [Endozoicomonadaceae bacterium]
MLALSEKSAHFLEQIIQKDLLKNQRLHLRFPPEPNGYLHIGHAKSICLNFGLAEKYAGQCNLRFDDTNPLKEEQAYIEAIQSDIKWLGYHWHDEIKYASNYFKQLYQWACYLIDQNLAYVDELSADQIRIKRGTLTEIGENSPFRQRSIADNKVCFEKMKSGGYAEGQAVLRAKIDMTHPNLNMRDPILYRIIYASHHQTLDEWCIYPSYDFAHGQEDAIEGITHSFCTLEFSDHRLLYDWFLDHLPVSSRPKQYEFAPLNLSYTLTSKRKLKQLIDEKYVTGWTDPRLPTLSGLRRRGVPPEAIKRFCSMIGVTKSDSVVDVSMLEFSIREVLNQEAPRAMAVMYPLKLTITNLDDGEKIQLKAPNHPQNDTFGTRNLCFTNTLYIDQADFKIEKPNKKWKRLYLGGEVRLRNSYVIHCHDMKLNENGEPIELFCTYDQNTLGKDPVDRKVKGVIHWVEADSACDATFYLYDRLFQNETPDMHANIPFTDFLNPKSLVIVAGSKVESSLKQALPGVVYQFEREGYFCLDETLSKQKKQLIFNRTIALKDTWVQ